MVMLLVSMNAGLFTLPRSGFVQQANKQRQKTVSFCSFVANCYQQFYCQLLGCISQIERKGKYDNS